MDFVESWFGISPDGGSGVFEACMILAVVIVGVAFLFRGRLQAAWYQRFGRVA